MFKRFTDRARRVVVLAQEEARMLNHNYIGTEHILLGLVHEGQGIAAKSLESLGISLAAVRQQVEEIIGQGQSSATGHIPFTPRAKKVLELSLREARQFGHDYIGTEHILLGLIREGEGVGAEVLVKLGADLNRARQQVIQLLSGPRGVVADVLKLPASVLETGSGAARAALEILERGRRLRQLAERLARVIADVTGDPSVTPEVVAFGLLPNPDRLNALILLLDDESELRASFEAMRASDEAEEKPDPPLPDD
jgi:ATP-dependent Clp protease ATP-binding subunit ClpC